MGSKSSKVDYGDITIELADKDIYAGTTMQGKINLSIPTAIKGIGTWEILIEIKGNEKGWTVNHGSGATDTIEAENELLLAKCVIKPFTDEIVARG
jgi:hypothetical protein